MDSAPKMTVKSEQKSRKVLKSLLQKQPQDLLLVIGTGVSAAVAPGITALRSWRSCIKAVIDVAEELEVLNPKDVVKFLRRAAKERDSLAVAHDLIQKMSPVSSVIPAFSMTRTGDAKLNFFQDCLLEIFDNMEQQIKNPVVLQSILRLMDGGAMVLTSNYDTFIESFGQQQGKPMESLDLRDKDKVLQWAKGEMKYGVLHIHGVYSDPCGVVFNPLRNITGDKKVKNALQNLYRTKAFLFMGCGETLRHQIFEALSLKYVTNKVDLEHFMIVCKEKKDQYFKLQEDLLLQGIKMISYGDCFDSFPVYVQDLTTQICKQGSPDADRVDSTHFQGKSCIDHAKRWLEDSGDEQSKRLRQADDGSDEDAALL